MKNSFTFLAILLFLFGCQEEVPCQNFALGEPIEIYLGETVSHCGENISISYEELISDSRCPTNADCIWQGMIEVKITANIHGKETTFNLSSEPTFGQQVPKSQEVDGYLITLENALPYPEIGKTANDKERLVILSIAKVEE